MKSAILGSRTSTWKSTGCSSVFRTDEPRTVRIIPHANADLDVRWLSERLDVDHDFLFTGWRERPLRKHTLRLLTNRALCGEGKLMSFSYHRLRHTAASKVYPAVDPLSVMHTFGWESQKVRQNYTRLLPGKVRESYARAMDQVEAKHDAHQSKPQSIEAYFAARPTPK